MRLMTVRYLCYFIQQADVTDVSTALLTGSFPQILWWLQLSDLPIDATFF
jgi:hypothetical protein